MKVALVVPGGVDRSGTKRVIPALLWLIRRVAARHELHVFTLFQEDAPGSWDLLGARVHNIGRRRTAIRGLRAIRAEHRRGPFALLHAIWASPCGTLAAIAGWSIRRPVLTHLFGGELVALHEAGYGERRSRGGRFRVRVATAGSTCITAQSETLAGIAARQGIRATRLPLGVALDAWPPVPPRPRDSGRPLCLIHVASLNAVKDPDTLLRTAAILRDRGVPLRLDVIGEDLTGGRMPARTKALGLDGVVTFHGLLEHSRVRDRLLEADLLVMTSRHEGGPMVLAEAAACGVPTVGTHVGQIADWAPAAALTAAVGDADGLAAAIARLAQDDPLRLRLAAAAQARALAEDADWSAARIEELYLAMTSR